MLVTTRSITHEGNHDEANHLREMRQKRVRYTGKTAIRRYCGSKYALEKDDVARQASTHIALDDDVARLLAKCEAEPTRARKYANLVLDIDPSNTRAMKELKEAAYNLGCNAVIGVDFNYITLEPETVNAGGGTLYLPYVFCVTANGNAVVIEKE